MPISSYPIKPHGAEKGKGGDQGEVGSRSKSWATLSVHVHLYCVYVPVLPKNLRYRPQCQYLEEKLVNPQFFQSGQNLKDNIPD